ncbi:hypothetical protein WA026_005942 [Henosepilachna vigintioctopunctata]|uniref:Globin domain-containing protein n=1 Tax=Henosepilachna vigintioctopunctata TaxID=420089 RepID=A0AAW1U3M9_9CUCU
MTMNKDRDLVHFNIIHSLTGWLLQHVTLANEGDVSADEMWEICVRCTKLYSWKSPNEESKTQSPDTIQLTKKKSKKKKKKKKRPKVLTPSNLEAKNPHSFVVHCKDMRFLKSNTVQEIAPCWGHEIVIDECRDIPLEQPPPDPEYPLWKKFRWIEWAKSNGLIDEPVELDRTRYVKCVAPFKQFSTLKVNTDDSQHAMPKKPEFPFRKSINVLAKNVVRSPVVPQINEVVSESERSHNEDTGTPRSDTGEKTKGKRESSASAVRAPSIWVKFDDLFNSLLAFDVFFKSSQFVHKARVSDLELSEIFRAGTRGSKKNVLTQKDKDTWQNVKCAKTLRERGNVPLYFFIDTLDTKLILINMCQSGDVERLVPMEDELSETNFFVEYERLFGNKQKSITDKPPSPMKPKLNRPRIHMNLKPSYLLFEEYRWDDAKTGRIISFLSTYGNSTTMLELDAGRHIFRLWTKSEFPFCITLLCDSDFSIGCMEQIVENMAVEPMQITQFSLDIAKAYADLVNSFGTDGYGTNLRDSYRSYLPKNANTILTKIQRGLIHDAFQNSFIQYLRNTQMSPAVDKMIDALRTLFLNVEYRIRTELPPERVFSSLQIHSLQEKIICERASSKLSAFFKHVQIMNLKKRHKLNHPKFNVTFETLKQIYSTVFSKDKRDEELGTVIRNFFDDPTIKDFLYLYDCSKDFRWDVDVQTYTGSADLTRDFAILCRYVLQCKSSVLLNIKLFCSIPHYALSVIDNDTNEEIYRFTNEIFPSQFVPNTFGYTIIGFAWSKEPTSINWKLVIISERKTKNQFSVEEVKTFMYNLFDNYVPICKSLIGKHTITLKENVVFTLRFSCSYKNLKFNIKLFDPDHNLMMDIVGKEKIILPSVLLKTGYGEISISSWRSRVSNRSLVPKGRQGLTMRSTVSDLLRSTVSKKEQAATRKLREIASEGSAFSNGDAVTYRLEIYVVDDSWPLTLVEWDNVKTLRESTYFIKRSKQELYDAVVLPSRSTTRSAKDFRKSTLKRVESIEKPWYLLQYAFKLNAHARLEKDRTEEDQTYSLKKSWYSPDPDRYQRSLDLRQKYIAQYGCLCPDEYNVSSKSWESMGTVETTNSNTIESSTPRQDGDDDNVYRTTKCPRCIEVGIPPFDLTPYFKTGASSDGQR